MLFTKTKQSKRDSQRSRVYKAEHGVERSEPSNISCVPSRYTDGAVMSFLGSFMDDKLLGVMFGRVSVDVFISHSHSKCSKAMGDEVWLYVRDNGISVYEILHEIAHVLQRGSIPPHGECFTSIFLLLVKQVMGDECYLALIYQFRKYKVKFTIINEEEIKNGKEIITKGNSQARRRNVRRVSSGKTYRGLRSLRFLSLGR